MAVDKEVDEFCGYRGSDQPSASITNWRKLVNGDDLKHRTRYKKMLVEVKRVMTINACYSDEIHRQQKKLGMLEQERHFLLQRCLQFEMKSKIAARSKFSIRVDPASGVRCSQRLPKNVVSKHSNKSKKKRQICNIQVSRSLPVDTTGSPIYPIALDNLTIHNLGEIPAENDCFHTEDYIYPAGFCSTRVYASIDHPERKCQYTCSIIRADDGCPRFEISPDDRLDFIITGFTATECHRRLLNIINCTVGSDVLNVSKNRGAEFFGFSHPVVQNLIQKIPGADRCRKYNFKKFETARLDMSKFTDHAVALNYEALQKYPPFQFAMSKKRQLSTGSSVLTT